jgi:hypothetical protein
MGWRSQVSAVAVTIITAALVASCSGDASTLDGTWRTLDVPAADLGASFPMQRATLVLDGGEYLGHDGCNSDLEYPGSFELEGTTFSADPTSQDQVGSDCAAGLLDWHRLLGSAQTASVTGDRELELRNADGELLAVLQREADK